MYNVYVHSHYYENVTSQYCSVFPLQVLGNETPLDLWMLSRISAAVEQCNKGFENYDFPMVTTACYNLWYNDVCDVYLEYLKPVFQSNDSAAISTAKMILHKCLHVGLRLLSPFMPFITEELFQRLPHQTEGHAASICIAPYPDSDEVYCLEQLSQWTSVFWDVTLCPWWVAANILKGCSVFIKQCLACWHPDDAGTTILWNTGYLPNTYCHIPGDLNPTVH